MTLPVVTMAADGPATKLAGSTANRILAAVSSFYEYAILSGLLERANLIEKRPDPALLYVSERHRPFMGRASREAAGPPGRARQDRPTGATSAG
ncbi:MULTISPECIES: hypothetical protein [unclassified Streptomyces]|uniref:hypothetical protein n=1 Tax=unclassified Streptomyces TaxID=2593676 RepID=UPI00093FCACF|nr:hypothetical protein [Streptomyces sp. TSRI0281]OKI44743.1 hypothetical protein A6A29_33915 [Streptomyces sp. TSRI0281]